MTTAETDLKPAVAAAVQQIRLAYTDVDVTGTGDGGAHIVVGAVPLSKIYTQAETWIGFTITFQYPYADVYPHFVRGDLARRDAAGLGEGMSVTTWPPHGGPVVQVSRRSKRLNPVTDTALLKLRKVVNWINNRP